MANVAWNCRRAWSRASTRRPSSTRRTSPTRSARHIAIVEVDDETGEVQLLRYVAVDDCGPQINPMIVDGQIHGGIVQGIGQALWEGAVYDDDGQLLTGSMMDYALPKASPASRTSSSTRRSRRRRSTRSASRASARPARSRRRRPSCNAVIDALAPLGIQHIDMPLTPARVWRAIQAAKAGGSQAMIPTAFDYVRATSSARGARRRSPRGEGAKVLAGGHSLLPLMKFRLAQPTTLVDIGGIEELRGIAENRQGRPDRRHDHATRELIDSQLLRERFPILAETADGIGDIQVRNRGTIGGAIAHADPASDMPAVMLALGAEFVLRSKRGILPAAKRASRRPSSSRARSRRRSRRASCSPRSCCPARPRAPAWPT